MFFAEICKQLQQELVQELIRKVWTGKLQQKRFEDLIGQLCQRQSSYSSSGAPPRGRQLYFTFPGAPDPFFKASKAPFLTLRVATPSPGSRGQPVKDCRRQSSNLDPKAVVQKGLGLAFLVCCLYARIDCAQCRSSLIEKAKQTCAGGP